MQTLEWTRASGCGKRTRALAVSIAAVLTCIATSAQAGVTISSRATKNMTCSAGVCTATAKRANLNVTDLQNLLAASNATVKTGSASDDIVVATALTWASSNTLTLDASHTITIDNPVAVAGPGGLALVTGDGGSAGALSFGATGSVTFWGLSSSLSINGKAFTLVNSVAMLASDIAADPNGRYALAASYDASVDGTYSSSPIATELFGTFEGLGNTISNLSISSTTTAEQLGLLAYVGRGGSLRDIGLVGANIKGEGVIFEIGSLAGQNDGSIAASYVTGAVNDPSPNVSPGAVGGLVGTNNGTISRSYASAIVTVGHSNSSQAAGGLVGDGSGSVLDSHATGSVSVQAATYGSEVGGLVGNLAGLVENSFSTGAISLSIENRAVQFAYVGGLAGAGSWIVNSHATGTVSVDRVASGYTCSGGLVGAQGTIEISFATGAVKGGDGSYIGGLVGCSGDVRESYATGAVIGGKSSYVGGLVGGISSVVDSYSNGAVAGKASAEVGGLIGNVINGSTVGTSYSISAVRGGRLIYASGFTGYDGSAGGITSSYWDTTTSGRKRGTGNRGNEPGITGLTTTQLQSGLPTGFNPAVWGENANINGGLPYLLALPPS